MMSDDLDELDAALRRAMAALDGEAPAGYFEALPARTLARLDDPEIGELPDVASERRVRPLRVAQDRRPPADDDDAVFSSQIMAAVELPGPAEPEALPRSDRASASSMSTVRPVPAVEAAGARPASAAPERGMRRASSVVALPPVPVVADLEGRPASSAPVPSSGAASGPVEAPAVATSSMTSAGLARHRRSRRMRAAIVGIGGIGLAAVAAIYLTAGDHGPRDAPSTVSTGGSAASETQVQAVSPDGGGTSPRSVAAGSASTGSGTGGTVAGARPDVASSMTGSAATRLAGSGSGAPQDDGPGAVDKPVAKFSGSLGKRPGSAKLPAKGGGGKLETELPDGVAGKGAVGKKPKSDRPRQGRTSLSGADIERTMTAVAGQARACFAGTRGTAALRVTVAPSGRVALVAVIGAFAGTPAGACVKRVVLAATFPPWSGAPQSFDYSYPRSD